MKIKRSSTFETHSITPVRRRRIFQFAGAIRHCLFRGGALRGLRLRRQSRVADDLLFRHRDGLGNGVALHRTAGSDGAHTSCARAKNEIAAHAAPHRHSHVQLIQNNAGIHGRWRAGARNSRRARRKCESRSAAAHREQSGLFATSFRLHESARRSQLTEKN